MFTEDKVTEFFCMADDFCKFFDSMMAKYTIPTPKKHKYHRWHTFQVCSTSSRQGRGHGDHDSVSWFRLSMPEAFELFIMLFKAINNSINTLLYLLLTFPLPLSLPLVGYIDIKVTIYRGQHNTDIRST